MIIVDSRLPEYIIQGLNKLNEVLLFKTDNITYDAISSHPDIFICELPSEYIVAPNLPEKILEKMPNALIGSSMVGNKYPYTTFYNFSICYDKKTEKGFAVGNFNTIDEKLRNELNKIDGIKQIHVNQGYARCNLIFLPNYNLGGFCFITSDKCIESELKKNSIEGVYVEPKNIRLEGFKNGFIGGCCGFVESSLVFLGSLKALDKIDEMKIIDIANYCAVKIIEFTSPDNSYELYDGGGIFYLESVDKLRSKP